MSNLHHPEATQAALALLRNGQFFHWQVITLLALVVYVYANEIEKRNWKPIAAGLGLYMVHWFVEIVNGLIQHFSGHALWTVPSGTSFLILVGVGVEISLMFSIAGLALAKLLPVDPKVKVLGVPNRLFFAVVNAAFFSIFELFLIKTPTFVWVYPWWGAVPVFITVYLPFFGMAMFCYDWPPKVQRAVIGAMAGVNAVMLILFAGILHWI
jgi:hypothetical protein